MLHTKNITQNTSLGFKKTLPILFILISFYLFFGIKNVNAIHCYNVTDHFCSVGGGVQECSLELLQCDYGCELDVTYPGNVCPMDPGTGEFNCDDYRCITPPVGGCTDPVASNYNSGADYDDGSCIYAGAPNNPEIDGEDWAIKDQDKDFYVSATDPSGYHIRFGLDWSIPKDGVVDEWVPSSGYINSGSWRYAIHRWSFVGPASFYALTQNEWGVNSGWTKKELEVYESEPTLLASPSSVVGGQSVTVSFDHINNPSSLDWIALYRTEADMYDFIDWVYVPNCTKTGGTPISTGSCAFTMPDETNNFIFRLFSNDGWRLLAPSNVVSVTKTEEGGGGGTTYNVTVRVLQSPGGNVRSADNIIDTSVCGSPCVKSYSSGSTVTLQAIPSSSYWKFNGWTGGGCFNTSTCVINVGVDTEISASFTPRLFIYIEQ